MIQSLGESHLSSLLPQKLSAHRDQDSHITMHTHARLHTALPSYTALKPCALTAKSVVNHKASIDPLLTIGEGSMNPDNLKNTKQHIQSLRLSSVSPATTHPVRWHSVINTKTHTNSYNIYIIWICVKPEWGNKLQGCLWNVMFQIWNCMKSTWKPERCKQPKLIVCLHLSHLNTTDSQTADLMVLFGAAEKRHTELEKKNKRQ